MLRVIVIALASFGLAGCASFSMDSFRPAPPTVQVRLESVPPGADAVTSVGPGCKTPCSVAVPASGNFTVSYTLNRFQPTTIPVEVINIPGDFSSPASTSIDPNPVVAELQPAGPPPRASRRPLRPKKPKAAKRAAAVSPAGSPFPAQAPAAAPAR